MKNGPGPPINPGNKYKTRVLFLLMTDQEKADRAWEVYREASHMALDLNQPADFRRAWESRRDAAWAEHQRATIEVLVNYYFPGALKENVAAE